MFYSALCECEPMGPLCGNLGWINVEYFCVNVHIVSD